LAQTRRAFSDDVEKQKIGGFSLFSNEKINKEIRKF
jgi:hypothetical protein